jgi:eukaryotic-like serine/threonine-protein kinase
MEGMPADGTGLPALGDEIAGKYRVEGVLGQGGMGAVFAARNTLTGKRVAIKWLLPEHAVSVTRERLLREAQIASSIDHPNVVDIYDVGEHQGGLFLVMEYLRGRPLSEVMTERGRLDPEEIIALLVPAMRGVHAAHVAGVIHRDLKPENIILSESDGQIVPKVLDFGVSKTNNASAVPASSLTRTGALVGTPHYMALEQVDGSNVIDARTDVYAFGVLLYRALTGHFPFDGSTLGEVILKIGTKEATPLRMLRPELPPALDALVLRALSRDRHKRFKDLEEFARALMPFAVAKGALSNSSHSGLTPGAVSFSSLGIRGVSDSRSSDGANVAQATAPAQGLRRRKRVLWAAAGLLLALLISAGLFATRDVAPTAQGPSELPSQSAPAAAAALVPVASPIAAEPRSETPTLAVAPEPPAQVAADPQVQAPAVAIEAGAALPTLRSARADKSTKSKPPRIGVKAPKAAPSLIPGERTNGLSVDEF